MTKDIEIDLEIQDSKTVQKRKEHQEIYEKHLKNKKLKGKLLDKKAKELNMSISTLRRIKEQGDAKEGFFSKKSPGKPKSFDTQDIELIEPKWILESLENFRNEMRLRFSLKKKIKESELDAQLISDRQLCDIKNEWYSVFGIDKKTLKKKMKENPLFSIHPLNIISKQQTKNSIAGSSCDISHSEESSSPLLSTYSTEQSTQHQDSASLTLSDPPEEESQGQNVLSGQCMEKQGKHIQQDHFQQMNLLEEEEESLLNGPFQGNLENNSQHQDNFSKNYLQPHEENLSSTSLCSESKIFMCLFDDRLSQENSDWQQTVLVQQNSLFYQQSLKTTSQLEEQYEPPIQEEDSSNGNSHSKFRQVHAQHQMTQTEDSFNVNEYFS